MSISVSAFLLPSKHEIVSNKTSFAFLLRCRFTIRIWINSEDISNEIYL
jgi:hypothetical protein